MTSTLLARVECAILIIVEHVIEVPGRALIDLLDLVETAEAHMREARVHPALIDALHGAAHQVRSAAYCLA